MNEKNGSCTLADIAKNLGISKMSVSLAMRDSPRVSASTKKKVRDCAKRMGYKANPLVSTVMSNIKASNAGGEVETIVLINANRDIDAPKKYPIFSKYAEGVKAEASALGYAVYEVWLYAKNLDAEKLARVLRSRGIRGGVIYGNTDASKLPQKFSSIWRNFTFVSAGTRTANPVLDFVTADKFLIAHHATTELIRRGYKRPALILDKRIDSLVEGRLAGGFLRAQLNLAECNRIPPLMDIQSIISKSGFFDKWLAEYNPDAILSVSNATTDIIRVSAVKFPDNIPLIEFERNEEGKIWKGMDKNYDKVGRLAVDRLFDLLNRPVYFKSCNVSTGTLVMPDWEDMR